MDLIAFFAVVLAIPLGLAGGAAVLAARSTPRERHRPVSRLALAHGAVLATLGLAVLAGNAWATREDVHYDDFGSAVQLYASMLGAALLFLGLGPFVAWALKLPARHAARLPVTVRLAAREAAGASRGAAALTAAVMLATGLAVTLMISAAAVTTQNRAHYLPQARPGALQVDTFYTDDPDAVGAAVREELPPGVPVLRSEETAGSGHVTYAGDGWSGFDAFVGDETLLRYLTGDPATPYDEDTAVLVTTEPGADPTIDLHYSMTTPPGEYLTKTIPAITARPADPRLSALFVPAKVVRGLGFDLEAGRFLVDPAAHRTTRVEQERLTDRLSDIAEVHVERGYEPATGWIPAAGALILLALGGGLAATALAARGSRRARVLRRAGGSPRRYAACRAGLVTACGALPGAAGGAVAGLLLAWPLTTSIEWDVPPRVAFDTPWELVAALAAGLPALAAALAALRPAR
ncbi:hypothetical protein [Nonomuraea sp. NPDC003214]